MTTFTDDANNIIIEAGQTTTNLSADQQIKIISIASGLTKNFTIDTTKQSVFNQALISGSGVNQNQAGVITLIVFDLINLRKANLGIDITDQKVKDILKEDESIIPSGDFFTLAQAILFVTSTLFVPLEAPLLDPYRPITFVTSGSGIAKLIQSIASFPSSNFPTLRDVFEKIRGSTYTIINGTAVYTEDSTFNLELQIDSAFKQSSFALTGQILETDGLEDALGKIFDPLLISVGSTQKMKGTIIGGLIGEVLQSARKFTNLTDVMILSSDVGMESTTLNFVSNVELDIPVNMVVINKFQGMQVLTLAHMISMGKVIGKDPDSIYTEFQSIFPNGMDDIFSRCLTTITQALQINKQFPGTIRRGVLVDMIQQNYGLSFSQYNWIFEGVPLDITPLLTPPTLLVPMVGENGVITVPTLSSGDIITIIGIGLTIWLGFFAGKSKGDTLVETARNIKTVILDVAIGGVVTIWLVETLLIYSEQRSIIKTIAVEISDVILIIIDALGDVFKALGVKFGEFVLAIGAIGTGIALAGTEIAVGETEEAAAEATEGAEIAAGEVTEGAEVSEGEVLSGGEISEGEIIEGTDTEVGEIAEGIEGEIP